MKEKFTLFDVVIYTVLAFFSISILYPLLNVVAISFSDAKYIIQNEITIFPKGFSLDAYAKIFENSVIPRSYLNTIVYTAAGTLMNIGMTALMAYPLSKSRLTGRGFIMKMILFTMFFSGGTIPTFLIVKYLKMLDTIWSLILPNAIWTTNLIIMISFYRSIPVSLFESAMLDGASEYRVFAKIALPLSKASMASIGLFYFIGHWNSYFLPLIYLQSADKYPIQLVLKNMLMDESLQTTNLLVNVNIVPAALKNATIFITIIPVLIVYPLVQKHFVKGVMIGSVKG